MTHRLLIPLYAALALGALVATWWHNIAFIRDGGSAMDFLTDGYANHVAASLINDLWFMVTTAFVFMLVDARQTGSVTCGSSSFSSAGIAVSVMFPLYLITQEREVPGRIDR